MLSSEQRGNWIPFSTAFDLRGLPSKQIREKAGGGGIVHAWYSSVRGPPPSAVSNVAAFFDGGKKYFGGPLPAFFIDVYLRQWLEARFLQRVPHWFFGKVAGQME